MRCKNCKKQTKTPFCSVSCLQEFGETDKGKAYIERISLNVKKEREKKERTIRKELGILVYEKENKKVLQKEINRLSKMIDAKCGYKTCICCHRDFGKQTDAAHYHSVGSNQTLRFNLHNIHSASSYCNNYSNIHLSGYLVGLEARYGLEYKDMILSLPQVYKSLKLSAKDIHDKLILVRSLIKNFDDYEFKDGIEGRELFNNLIGIY